MNRPTLRCVAVLGAESELASPEELTAARRLGAHLAASGITMVCSGESVGAIGVAVDAAVRGGGTVIGITLEDRANGAHPGLTELRRVRDHAQQRAELAGVADAYVALPGAFASLDDALAVLGVEASREVPIGLVDEGNAYTKLIEQAPDAALDRFVRESQRGLVVMSTDVGDLVARLREYRPPETRRAHPPGDA
jgi:uncharacterized protein (TIGR00730 family)